MQNSTASGKKGIFAGLRDNPAGKDCCSALFLLALGVFLAWQSVRLSVWGASGPEAGFYPLLLAILITGLSAALAVRSIFLFCRERSGGEAAAPVNLLKVAAYLVLSLLYGILISQLGFLLSSGLLLIFFFKIVEKQSVKTTMVATFVSIFLSYLIFIYFLKIPLPSGFLLHG